MAKKLQNHQEVIAARLTDPEFEAAYEIGRPEVQLGAALTMLREALDVSQQELAAKAGVSREHVGRLENRPMNVSLTYLARLLSALNTDCELLLHQHATERIIAIRLTPPAASPSHEKRIAEQRANYSTGESTR